MAGSMVMLGDLLGLPTSVYGNGGNGGAGGDALALLDWAMAQGGVA